MNMKKHPYCIYLNQYDKEKLNEICKSQKINKSSLFRKLIFSEKYIKGLEEIENYNKINKELLYQIKRCGANLNQIAYHFNIDINEEEKTKDKITQIFEDFSKLLKDYEKKIKPNFIPLNQRTSLQKRIHNE